MFVFVSERTNKRHHHHLSPWREKRKSGGVEYLMFLQKARSIPSASSAQLHYFARARVCDGVRLPTPGGENLRAPSIRPVVLPAHLPPPHWQPFPPFPYPVSSSSTLPICRLHQNPPRPLFQSPCHPHRRNTSVEIHGTEEILGIIPLCCCSAVLPRYRHIQKPDSGLLRQL